MEAGPRRIWAQIGLVLLVAVVVGAVTYLFRAPNRDSAGTLVAALAAVATVVGPSAVWLWTQMRRTEASYLSLNHAADQLAEEVRQQWERAAGERGLMYPAPISVRWQWSGRQVTGPVEAAAGRAGEARFAPMPGIAAITTKKLRSGTIKDLFGVHGGLGSGRLVILGGPGAGKSSAAIRLLLDGLSHRAAFETAEERARVPVPVLFTLHGWDPHSERFASWLAGQLTRDYTLLRAREYGRDAAARLIGGGYIAVILDGLDEMAEALRPLALQALDEQATFRLVVLTRSQEMVTAVGDGHLRGAAALELRSVQGRQAAEYLASAQIDPAPPSWQHLIKHLRDHPDGALAQALETPLMVTLVRDTYRADDPVGELTDGTLFASREAIENHLLDRVLPAAYAHRPGHPTPEYTQDQARCWLRHLARRMNAEGTRDLAWWQIPHWVPAWPRAVATVLACELVVGPLVGLAVGLVVKLVVDSGVGWALPLVSKLGLTLTFGLVIGFMGAFGDRPPRALRWLRRSETGIRKNLLAGFVYGFMFGLVGGLMNGLVTGFVRGLVYGVVVGLVTGSMVSLAGTFGERPPRHLSRLRWVKNDVFVYLMFGLVFGLTAGFMYGFVAENGFGPGLLLGVVVWLVVGLAVGAGRPSAEVTSPIDPHSSWHRNRQFGFMAGLVVALAYGLVQSFVFGLSSWLLVIWLVSGIAMGISVGLVFPATWQVTLASAQLWLRGEAPARFLRFLEDAHNRQILRTVGQVYQFRHGQLQDRLACMNADSAQAPPFDSVVKR
ncbi:MAG: hypothetical protein QOI89_3416 [Solirubrobacteraceae bacterium]|jgi:hypothetical protein|nr:hypothetical protein [Solirubrobacteraceae bacterium]